MLYESCLGADGLRFHGLARLLGYDPDEIPATRQWWDAQIHPEDVARASRALGRLQCGDGVCTAEYRIRHKRGHWVSVMEHACLAFGDAQGGRVLGAVTDLSGALSRQAAQYLDEVRRKDECLALLGHELRNPLASIHNAVEVWRCAEVDPGLARMREIVTRQTAHLSRMLDDLLDASRLTRGKIALHRELLDLGELVSRCVQDSRAVLEDSGPRLELHVPDAPLVVDADGSRLEQIVSNLLNNAVKFSPADSTIVVTVGSDAQHAFLSVQDAGPGIDPLELADIFTPFYQSEHARTACTGGLGLGLSLVKSLAELHGGQVRATSAGVGSGALFVVTLPRMESDACEAIVSSRPSLARSVRILVVEDNVDAAESLRVLLERQGHSVQAAYDARSGLEKAHLFHPDVVLCDIGLPGAMDGYGFARRARADPDLEGTFLVAMTGFGQEEDLERAMEAGFHMHLTKPADAARLQRLLARAPARSAC